MEGSGCRSGPCRVLADFWRQNGRVTARARLEVRPPVAEATNRKRAEIVPDVFLLLGRQRVAPRRHPFTRTAVRHRQKKRLVVDRSRRADRFPECWRKAAAHCVFAVTPGTVDFEHLPSLIDYVVDGQMVRVTRCGNRDRRCLGWTRWRRLARGRGGGEDRHRHDCASSDYDAWEPRAPARRRIRVLHTDSRVSWLLARPRPRASAIRKSDTYEDPQSGGPPCIRPAPARGNRTLYCDADSVVSGSTGTP
jgi:hypothetical protein